jgi:Tfp pilus assembly protein PilN
VRPVNLLPARYRPRTGSSGDSKTAYVALASLALLAVAVFGYVTTANKVSTRNAEIAAARQQIDAAEAQSVTLQGFGDFAGVKEARLSAVKELATSRLDWERLFRELAHVLPENVWLTGFDAQGGGGSAVADAGGELGPKATLKGCADSHARIADAMIRLRELHVAEDVELTQTTAGEDGEEQAAGGAPAASASESGCGKYYSFEVAVTMAMPIAGIAPETSEPVPARLGGGG